MTFLRHRQRAITSVSPHVNNPNYAIPARTGGDFSKFVGDGSSLSTTQSLWPGLTSTPGVATGIGGINFTTSQTVFYYTPDAADIGASVAVTWPAGTLDSTAAGSMGPAGGAGGAILGKYFQFVGIPDPVPIDGDVISWPGGTGIIHRAQGIASNIDLMWAANPTQTSCILQCFINDIGGKVTNVGDIAPLLANGAAEMDIVKAKALAAGFDLAVQNVSPFMGAGSAGGVPDWNPNQQICLEQWNSYLTGIGVPIIDTYTALGGPCLAYTIGAAFALGETVTGGTSGAVGIIDDIWPWNGVEYMLFKSTTVPFENAEGLSGSITGSGTTTSDSSGLGLLKQYQRASDNPTDKLHWEPATGHQLVADICSAQLRIP